MGCIDLRTARMHLKRLEETAKTMALTLAEQQAAAVHLHETDEILRPLAPLERLEKLLDRQMEGQLRAGAGRCRPVPLRSLLQAELWKKKRKTLTSYVSRPPPDACYTF